MRRPPSEPDPRLEGTTQALLREGVLERVGDDDASARLWMDTELCSFVENRRRETPDPHAMTEAERRSWQPLALTEHERIVDPRKMDFEAPFWILVDGERAGTVALPTWCLETAFLLRLSSIYVFPAHRRTGVAQRTIRRILSAALAARFDGIRIDTFWTWQRAVQLYFSKLEMWAWSFKHSLGFVAMPSLPARVIAVDGQTATFSVVRDGKPVQLIRARRTGERLRWSEAPEMSGDSHFEVHFHARSTLAVALALAGWPLLRSRRQFERSRWGDIGGPEVLAQKIAVFEWLDRRAGFDVPTPRIPGLPYAEIERELEDSR